MFLGLPFICWGGGEPRTPLVMAFLTQSFSMLTHPFSIMKSAALFGSSNSASFAASILAALEVIGFLILFRWSITSLALSLSITERSSSKGVGFFGDTLVSLFTSVIVEVEVEVEVEASSEHCSEPAFAPCGLFVFRYLALALSAAFFDLPRAFSSSSSNLPCVTEPFSIVRNSLRD